MKRFVILMLLVMLVVGCSNNSPSSKEREEISSKKYKAYTHYALKEKESIDFAKKQAQIMENEKNNIVLLVKQLEEKLSEDGFLDDLSKEVKAYLETIKAMEEEQINELEKYLAERVDELENKHAIIQKEKELANLEQDLEERPVSDWEDSYEETPNIEIVPTYKNGILIVNKKHPLPFNYSPGEDPTAVSQLRLMINDMRTLGYDISNSYSGFRTYSHQKDLYQRYVNSDGQEAADTYSARPGHSEHQTGLTYDLLHSNGTLVESEPEVSWIAQNAANYGFIVRYQAGKENITGYQVEPWHLRYIGDEASTIFQSGLTLEEYLGVEGGDYSN